MARKPSAKKQSNKAVAGLLDALKFIEPASKEIGQINQTHCMFGGNWVAAFDGLIMMAAKVDTDIVACPNTKRLIAVLSKCDEATQITQMDIGRIGIKSGKFAAYIPCVDPALLAFSPPDPPAYTMNDAVMASLNVVGIIAKENAPRMVSASVLLRENSAVACDGIMAFEHWHGTPLPTVVLPKAFITLLGNIKKKPVSLGSSHNTCTVYFEDQSFIRTQLYTEPYPNIDKILNEPSAPLPLPAEFWPAVNKLLSMRNENNDIIFNAKGSLLQTDTADIVGASYNYEHPLPNGVRFNIELLARFTDYATQADFVAGNRKSMAAFFGTNFRGVLMQKVDNVEQKTEPTQPAQNFEHVTQTVVHGDVSPVQQYGGMIRGTPPYDDEIPF